jgi:hypothetical protein
VNHDYQIRNYIRDKRLHSAFFSDHQHLILFLVMTEQDHGPLPSTIDTEIYATASYEPSTELSLKRRASPSFEGLEEDSRKRMKEDDDPEQSDTSGPITLSIMKPSLVDELAEELQCGCCSELVYKPVIVSPCQHFFCGRSFLYCHYLYATILIFRYLVAVCFGYV